MFKTNSIKNNEATIYPNDVLRVLVRVNQTTTAQTALARNACVTALTQRQSKTLVTNSAANVSTPQVLCKY